jgi:hypothetical protein
MKEIMERYMYLVFAIEKEREVILGIFSSARRAQVTIKKLSNKKQYFIYKLPINNKIAKGTRKLENQLSKYLYQDLGTFKSEFIEVDDNDQIIKEGIKKVVFWPK